MTAPPIAWSPIQPLGASGYPRDTRFDALDSLQKEWQRQLLQLTSEELARRRRRSLEKHRAPKSAIDRLQGSERGLLRILVAEGFAREAVARSGEGNEDPTTLEMYLQAVSMGLEIVSNERPVTSAFIRELHHALTANQPTYVAHDQHGVEHQVPLEHGAWKTLPNRITASHSARHACPPEHVESQVEQLLMWWTELESRPSAHPLVRQSWFHHRFLQIHPFPDGNGRVARALTSLLMQRHGLPPFVLEEEHRGLYFDVLDRANEVSLTPLSTFLAELATRTMLRELEPTIPDEEHDPIDIAKSITRSVNFRKIMDRESQLMNERVQRQQEIVCTCLLVPWFESQRRDLLEALSHPDVESEVEVRTAPPVIDQPLGDPWIETHIAAAAQKAKQSFALGCCVTAVSLRMKVEGEWLIFGAVSYRLSAAAGLMVLVPFSNAVEHTERFFFTASDDADDLKKRENELSTLLRTALAQGMSSLRSRIVPNPS